MKQAKILSLALLCCLYLLTSCGDAGIQVKVGGEYDTDFGANQAGLELLQNFNESASTSVNSEIKDFGDRILELEVTSLVITMRDFRENQNSITGEIIIEANNIEFNSGPVELSNGAIIPLQANQSNFNNLSNRLKNGDVSIALEVNADEPFGDNNFDIELAITAFATVQVDENQ
ncbi:hypothetical protein [Ekhidna sp.]|uniref:hypothetical protein n=1 Tax=Ekhidna sp. TaxID=2608089 RepID=UPI003CCB8A0D